MLYLWMHFISYPLINTKCLGNMTLGHRWDWRELLSHTHILLSLSRSLGNGNQRNLVSWHPLKCLARDCASQTGDKTLMIPQLWWCKSHRLLDWIVVAYFKFCILCWTCTSVMCGFCQASQWASRSSSPSGCWLPCTGVMLDAHLHTEHNCNFQQM